MVQDTSVTPSLESRVPVDHPLRTVVEQIDFSDARGLPIPASTLLDAVVAVKLYFLGFIEGATSEREILGRLGYRLDWMWFCGLAYSDRQPDLTQLLRMRATWGPDRFEDVVGGIIKKCAQLRLIDEQNLKMDRRKRVTKTFWSMLEQAAPSTSVGLASPAELAASASAQGPSSASTESAATATAVAATPDKRPGEHSAEPAGDLGPPAGLAIKAPGASSPRKHGRMVCEMLSSSLGPVLDLSGGGMKVLVHSRRAPRRDKCQTIKLQAVDGVMRVQGVIVWARRFDARSFVVGVRFEGLSPSDVARLKDMAATAGVRRALRPVNARRAA